MPIVWILHPLCCFSKALYKSCKEVIKTDTFNTVDGVFTQYEDFDQEVNFTERSSSFAYWGSRPKIHLVF